MTIGMFPPSVWAVWHEIAECFQHGNMDFAFGGASGIADCGADPNSKYTAPDCQYRYPSLSKRPDPFRVRSCLSGSGRQATADVSESRRIRFLSAHKGVEFTPIRNLAGGRRICGSRNTSLGWRSLRHCQGVSKTMPNAGWRVLRAARSLPTSRVATRLPVLSSGGRPAFSATTSISADNLLIKAESQPYGSIFQTTGATGTGGFLLSPPGIDPGTTKGWPCSKRY